MCNYLCQQKKNRTRCETCSKLTIKTPERRHCYCCGDFIVNFENIAFFFWYLLVTIFVYSSLLYTIVIRNVSVSYDYGMCKSPCSQRIISIYKKGKKEDKNKVENPPENEERSYVVKITLICETNVFSLTIRKTLKLLSHFGVLL